MSNLVGGWLKLPEPEKKLVGGWLELPQSRSEQFEKGSGSKFKNWRERMAYGGREDRSQDLEEWRAHVQA